MAVIGFIGLGNMGFPMACRLKEAGHEVRCFDVSASSMERAHDAGLQPRASVDEAVAGADSRHHDAAQRRAMCWRCSRRERCRSPPDALVIDCSTIDVASCAAFHETLQAQGPRHARRARLRRRRRRRRGHAHLHGRWHAKPPSRVPSELLRAMGKNIIHAGAAGAGQAAKICNNMLAGISMLAVSEALHLAKRLGLDTQEVLRDRFDFVRASAGRSRAMHPSPASCRRAPSNRGYEGGFASELMLKDLRLAEQAAIASQLARAARRGGRVPSTRCIAPRAGAGSTFLRSSRCSALRSPRCLKQRTRRRA